MANILLIEDEENSRKFLHESISCYGNVSSVGALDEMDTHILKHKYDLIIADFYLKDKNCFQILSDYRYQLGPVPLILISGRPSVEMLTQAIEEKVYAFIEKPVDIKKLKRKIETFYTFNPDFVINGAKLILFQDDWSVKVDDNLTELTETEFKILRYLLERENQVIDRQELIQYLWGNSKFSRNKLDTHLTNLKNKLPFIKKHLHTIPRVGFKLK
ncbi:MAG: response regulator transcription factor [Bacteriovorax sp.]|nr:response regulator transcription factor [Bacteriovorax sp.]